MGKLQEAWAQMTWMAAGVKEHLQEFRRSRIKRQGFSDMFQAGVYVSNPKFGLLPEEIEQIMQQAALRELSRVPTSREEFRDRSMTAAYVRYRWGSLPS